MHGRSSRNFLHVSKVIDPALDPVIRCTAGKFLFNHPGAYFLHTMADTDGKNQEWRQNIHWVQAVAQQAQRAHLPDHSDQGAGQWQYGQPDGPRIQVQQNSRDHKGNQEKPDDGLGPIGYIADDLGKTDDMNSEIITFELGSDRFELCGYFTVIQLFPGLGVLLKQVGPHHGAGEIGRNQSPHLTRFDDI